MPQGSADLRRVHDGLTAAVAKASQGGEKTPHTRTTINAKERSDQSAAIDNSEQKAADVQAKKENAKSKTDDLERP